MVQSPEKKESIKKDFKEKCQNLKVALHETKEDCRNRKSYYRINQKTSWIWLRLKRLEIEKDMKERHDHIAAYCRQHMKDHKDRDDYNEIFENCFLGNSLTALNKKLLKEMGITHVLNAAQGDGYSQIDTDQKFYDEIGVKFMGISLADLPRSKIEEHIDQGVEFIHQAVDIDKGKVLVHCYQGVSRSATFVLAYLIKYKNFKVEKAIEYTLKKRYVSPNKGFLIKLLQYEKDHLKE